MSSQPSLPSDICRNKHRGNANSEAANLSAQPRKQNGRERIVTWLEANPSGATREELSRLLKMPYTSVSGRVSELLAEEPRRILEQGSSHTENACTAAIVIAWKWRKQ